MLRYLFYHWRPKEIRRYSFKTGEIKGIDMKVYNYRLYVDHVNKRLYYFETWGNKSDIIYSMDYNGRSLDDIKLSEKNLGAIAVFGEFLYRQKLNKAVLEEIDISTNLKRKISLPKPTGFLGDIAIIEKSQHSKGMIFIIYFLVSKRPKIYNGSLLDIKKNSLSKTLSQNSSFTILMKATGQAFYIYVSKSLRGIIITHRFITSYDYIALLGFTHLETANTCL